MGGGSHGFSCILCVPHFETWTGAPPPFLVPSPRCCSLSACLSGINYFCRRQPRCVGWSLPSPYRRLSSLQPPPSPWEEYWLGLDPLIFFNCYYCVFSCFMLLDAPVASCSPYSRHVPMVEVARGLSSSRVMGRELGGGGKLLEKSWHEPWSRGSVPAMPVI